MNLRISLLLATGAIALLGSGSSASEQPTHSPKAQKELSQALAGRVAGPPVDCIRDFRGDRRMKVIDDWTIIFRAGDVVYVQNPPGGCPNLGRPTSSLKTRMVGRDRLCTGDIHQVVDSTTGIFRGTCAFAPFVPYRKVG
jgi:hypothetical protein